MGRKAHPIISGLTRWVQIAKISRLKTFAMPSLREASLSEMLTRTPTTGVAIVKK
ncbi:MAG: hypothetical protein HWQ38_15970 [Nostoc sp. NMS7]|uniref:hypothetical protein n=1 Tax=Nostoc sp. NMS7 TaxID=2815391 RepID=UPI0025DC96E3|nr:hypothetical protein [Nostoc sp. NMS7]MBN3947871.1 hypothetical protein [Nostoc sp. NMS7]